MVFPFKRSPHNPIIRPGQYNWRRCVTFNPGVLYEKGKFYLYERAAPGLRPFYCYIGMLESEDGVHFKHTTDKPVFTPEMAGSKYGSVQDPRVVKIDDKYYMTYAYRPFTWHCNPTGVGVPESYQGEYPGFDGDPQKNMTRTGIAVSEDRVHWKHHSWPTPAELDDRDVILFPEKINGRYALLRRPLQFIGPQYDTQHPAIWISYSTNMKKWTKPDIIAKPAYKWEDNRIGASTPPIRTEHGWLLFYHGVENENPQLKHVVYRLGAMLLDLENPTKIIARTSEPIMEPEEYYEKQGLFIPDVIFPTGAVVTKGILYLYYGCCDTAIGMATAPLDELVQHVLKG